MAFQQGLSGLNAMSKGIDVTSHNIANVSTVGYKSSRAQFADLYASSLNLAGNNRIGIGATLAAVQQQFSQGNLTSTTNSLDLGINGAGFFRMVDNSGSVSYTRNGQFHLNSEGFVVNDTGLQITGFPALNGVIQSTTPQPVKVSNANIPPVATGQNPVSNQPGVNIGINLDSREVPPAFPWVNGAIGAPWTPDVSTYNKTTSIDVYDSLGNAHTLSFYFVKTANPNEWEVHTNVDNTSSNRVTLTPNVAGLTTMTFDTSGRMLTPMPFSYSIDLAGINADLGLPNNGALTPLNFNINFAETTQFAAQFGVNSLSQDGYASGFITGLSVSDTGVVLGNYSNGQSFVLSQLALANFMNVNGLQPVGNNQWKETSESGVPVVGVPSSSNLGVIRSAFVEESNVDLTSELVNLITFQRYYQANAKSITTQSEILQTVINM